MESAAQSSLSGPGPGHDVATLLRDVVGKRPGAETALLEVVYGELRSIAGSFFKTQRADHTLQPTALVHEAFLKLMGGGSGSYENRAHFIGVAAKAMRQVLIDHARHKRSAKLGGDLGRMSLSGVVIDENRPEIDALDVHELLDRLTKIDERQARVVELRFFAGLTVPEAALVLGVSDRTVELDWRLARAWLRRELDQAGARPA